MSILIFSSSRSFILSVSSSESFSNLHLGYLDFSYLLLIIRFLYDHHHFLDHAPRTLVNSIRFNLPKPVSRIYVLSVWWDQIVRIVLKCMSSSDRFPAILFLSSGGNFGSKKPRKKIYNPLVESGVGCEAETI